MIYAAWFLAGLTIGTLGSWFVFGLISAARLRDEEEERYYDELRPPAWVSEDHPIVIVAIPHAEVEDPGVELTRFNDDELDAQVYRFRRKAT